MDAMVAHTSCMTELIIRLSVSEIEDEDLEEIMAIGTDLYSVSRGEVFPAHILSSLVGPHV